MALSHTIIINAYEDGGVRFANFSDGATIREDSYSCECSIDEPDDCPHFAVYDEEDWI